jgi:hypothetical protein
MFRSMWIYANNLHSQSVSCDASESQNRNNPSFLNNAHKKEQCPVQYKIPPCLFVTDFIAVTSPIWQYRPIYHRSKLANNVGGGVSTIGIRNCNFWMTQVRNGKYWFEPVHNEHRPFLPCHPKCTHSWLTKLFLGRKKCCDVGGRGGGQSPLTPPPSYAYAAYQWLGMPVVSAVLCLSTETFWHTVISVVDTEVHAAREILSLAFLILHHISLYKLSSGEHSVTSSSHWTIGHVRLSNVMGCTNCCRKYRFRFCQHVFWGKQFVILCINKEYIRNWQGNNSAKELSSFSLGISNCWMGLSVVNTVNSLCTTTFSLVCFLIMLSIVKFT